MANKNHIVDCLNNNVKVESSSIIYWNNKFHLPEVALQYNTDEFFSTDVVSGGWWQIDFKKTVAISSYMIVTGSICAYVSNWTISLSMDNRTFVKVDEHSGYYPSGVYQLAKIYNTRYLRIHGNSFSTCERYIILAFNYVYFYGSITPINLVSCKCRRYDSFGFRLSMSILILYS